MLETEVPSAGVCGVGEGAGGVGPVWVCDPGRTVLGMGLANNLAEGASVHYGWGPPRAVRPASAILCSVGADGLEEGLGYVRRRGPGARVLVFSPCMDLPLAWTALKLGARGYLHAGMRPEQVLRAVRAAESGEVVAPRKLLEYVVEDAARRCPHELSARRRQILELVADGLTNAQIARRLFLSESTVKQHLYAAYRLLGVRNRTEAAGLVRGGARSS